MIDAPARRSAAASTNTLVIGDGVIGLSIALELDRMGIDCVVLGTRRPGAASTTAGGLLAPSVGRVAPAAQAFYDASLALYPAFVDSLRRFAPGLRLSDGLLVVHGDENAGGPNASRLAANEARALEPELVAPHGASLYARDGAVDNELLESALRAAVLALEGPPRLFDDAVLSVERRANVVAVATESGRTIDANTVVLAAGAWAPSIAGLPRVIPIEPVKGQMIAISCAPLRRPVIGNGVYVVPRANETLVGSTLERTGFETSTDRATVERLRAAAGVLCPALARHGHVRAWAGLRPVTPDMLPVLGTDPDWPSVVYACGHSKNGILLAPATAKAIAELISGQAPGFDLSPFAATRFGSI